MSDIINSFTETTNKLVDQVNIALEFAQKTNESLTTQDDSVTMSVEEKDPITGDPSTVTYKIPSYNTMINKVNNSSLSVDTFIKGDGVILLADGTYREVKTTPVAVSPAIIYEIQAPSTFGVKNNWFFEDLMFPQITVKFDLKGKIDDRSDRIVVRRVIFDNYDEEQTQWFLDNIADETRTYYEVITILDKNNKRYWEDDQIHNLPLYSEPYTGYFIITDIKVIDSKQWYYLDTLKYGIPSDEPIVKDLELGKGNKLRYKNSTYKIVDINIAEQRVQLVSLIGMDHPALNRSFEIYSEPFSTKIAEIPVGYDECNSMFLKGINDDYNIIADEWSNSISFYTNNLSLENNVLTLEEYYEGYVSDFGKEFEAKAKEKFIPAWYGLTPDAPVLDAAGLEVSQINTQINAALDTKEVKNSQTQIESTKTVINSLKNTIAQQKAELVAITDPAQREDLNSKITINVSDLAKRTVEYQSLVRSLSTIAYESDAVSTTPKYRLRGFFDIPDPKKVSTNAKPQEIIQFEIWYRYLKLDNTGTDLKTYTHTDTKGSGKQKRGVYSDWTQTFSSIKDRVYDSSLGYYIWVEPNIADGDVININQIDIPITKGEKVEIKARSISEAGWPQNLLKSEWSESITKEFPANLAGSDQVTNILLDAVSEENSIKLNETLNASGITTHMSDSIPNPLAGDGTYFKHQSVNIAFDLSQRDVNGTVISTATTDLQRQLSNLTATTFLTITKPNGAVSTTPHVTGTLQKLLQAIVNIEPNIYDEFESLI